jgi:hypothetical protein
MTLLNRTIGLVGARGFEPPTTCTPCRCATRLRYAPFGKRWNYILSVRLLPALPFEQVQYVLEFQPDLVHDLLALGDILLGILPGHLLPGTPDRKALLI